MRKIGIVGIITGICAVLGVGFGILMLLLNEELVTNGALQVAQLIAWSVWGFMVLMLFANVLFSSKFLQGKAQEILFYVSVSVLISGIFAYIVFCLFMCNLDFTKLDWYGFLYQIIAYLDWRYYSFLLVIWVLFTAVYATFIDKNLLNFSGGFVDKNLKQVEGNLENSRWMTREEIAKQFKPTLYSKLGELKKDGVPVGAELTKNGKDMKVAFSSPCHSIIIGSTGSGKTTTFVSPMIQLLGATAAGSSMVVTDPKGELFSLHSKYLKSRGYDVRVVDLRDTYSSYRWNPLDSVWDNYQSYLNANKNVYLRSDNVKESGLKLTEAESAFERLDSYYEFDGKAYADKQHLIEAIKVFKKKTYDEVYEDLNDLCSVLIPIENEKDPMWEKGARSIVFAVLLAMLEDSEDERLGMTKEKYNFFNMTKILQNSSNDYKELQDYFKGRRKLSRALALSKQVCDAATQTRASYMSIVYDKLTMFNDAGICALTSASDFTAGGLAERPTALFLKIPDEKDTRHNLAAIFILNIYKTLIKIASATEELTLNRNVYFIMDEFGNMPKIEKFDKFITVGRSRKIWFTMIVQSYSQLNNVYGETVADIVKGNCGIKMFIGSNDAGTCKEYSELCGNITVVTRSRSGSANGTKDESYSDSTQVRPLIYPSELQRLNHPGDIGHSIIVTFGNFPLKTYFTPSFKVKMYQTGKMDTSDTDRYFDENKIAYSCPDRNRILREDQMARDAEADKGKKPAELKMGTVNGTPVNPPEGKPAEAPNTEPEKKGAQPAVITSSNYTTQVPECPEELKDRLPEDWKTLIDDYNAFMATHPGKSAASFYSYMLLGRNKKQQDEASE